MEETESQAFRMTIATILDEKLQEFHKRTDLQSRCIEECREAIRSTLLGDEIDGFDAAVADKRLGGELGRAICDAIEFAVDAHPNPNPHWQYLAQALKQHPLNDAGGLSG